MQSNNHKFNTDIDCLSSTQINVKSNLLLIVLEQIEKNHQTEKAMIDGNKKFQIKQYNISGISVKKVRELYTHIQSKQSIFYFRVYLEENIEQGSQKWYDNELRVYIWFLICYTYIYKKTIEEIASFLIIQSKKEWIDFSEAFNGKSPYLLEYQAKIIKKTNRKSKKWVLEEDISLNKIIQQFEKTQGPIQSFRWSQYAKKLFIQSNKKYFRTPKQCRERWMNHLDPEKVKSKWTTAQDYFLISQILKEGKKWAKISKLMSNTRTEHMVKNRFNSLIKNELKRHEQVLDETRIIKKLHNKLKYSMDCKNTEKDTQELESKQKFSPMDESQTSQDQNVFPITENMFMEMDEDLLEIQQFLKMDQQSANGESVYLKEFDQMKGGIEPMQLPIWSELF